MSGVRNYCVAVLEEGEDITFLRTIVPGSTDKSYGIHVARLAGLPEQVLERAREILEQQPRAQVRVLTKPVKKPTLTPGEVQVLEELAGYNLMAATPLEAMEQIFRWQKMLHKELDIVKRSRG